MGVSLLGFIPYKPVRSRILGTSTRTIRSLTAGLALNPLSLDFQDDLETSYFLLPSYFLLANYLPPFSEFKLLTPELQHINYHTFQYPSFLPKC